MKTALLFSLTLFSAIFSMAQTTLISGRLLDNRKKAIEGGSISLKDSYDGGTSDSAGNFKFSTTEKGAHTIVFSSMGYKTVELPVTLAGEPVVINASLKEEMSELKAVVITAGSFAASDEKKTTVLKPLDIVTTASAQGDVASAMKTLPGAQQVGESAELFVRGGAGYETRQFIDGTTVANPNFAQAPDIASRGRFSPFLFKGTVFSTGGYSALYGQALSSALILESIDLPERSSASAGLSFLFWSGQYQSLAKNKKSSWGGSISYANLGLYFKAVKQTPDYFRTPQVASGDLNFRIKTSPHGMLKFFTSYNYQKMGLRNANIDSAELKDAIGIGNNNWYNNLSYRERIANRWKLNAGLSFSYNKDDIHQQLQDAQNTPVTGTALPFYLALKTFDLKNGNLMAQARAVLEYKMSGLNVLRFGGEYWYNQDVTDFDQFHIKTVDHFKAGFAETDIFLTNDLAAKIGARLEHSSLMERVNFAPRISLAYKLTKKGQVSVAYGSFYQKPQVQYLSLRPDLNYMKADHLIANYQVVDALHTFRVEAFYKKYKQLLKFNTDTSNSGTGYAQGIEVFWRDKQTFKGVDYWVSYSYLDTERDYLNFPYTMTPNFAARHTANLVVKKFFTKLKTQINANYQFATGRPYYDIRYDNGNSKFYIRDQGRTISYNSLSFSANYLTTMGKAFAVAVLSVTNVLGSKQVYGYNYSYDGTNRTEINPAAAAGRFYFIGLFLSWGVDRTQDAINNNL